MLHLEAEVGAPIEVGRLTSGLRRGELVAVHNSGLRTGSAEDIARLRRDEPVDPARIYVRSTPRFETAAPRLAGLMTHLFVGVGTRQPTSVTFGFFQVE